jgi:ABC-type multidrug transport system fused ATPase/permease subunit
MLSLLKTKFELFKNDAGKAGFFDEAKKGVLDIIDMFDTMGGKSLAFDIGRGLGEAVILVREAIDFFSKWGDTIKTVGKLFLFYYGSKRLMQLGAGIKSFADARMAAYQQEVTKAREAAKISADTLRDQAFNLRAKAQMEESAAARSTQLAGQLYAEQARYSNQIADLEKRNLGWAGQQKIDRLTARRDETREAIVEIQTEAVARRQQADEMRKVADAHDRLAEATRAGTTASRQDIAVVNQANAERQKATDLLNQKAAAAVSAGNGISFMGRAMMGVNSVVNAFGGWINVAIMALGFMVAKLREALSFWKRVQEAVDAASQGVT